MVDLKKAEPVGEYWVHGQNKGIEYYSCDVWLYTFFLVFKKMPTLCFKHDLALMVVTGGRITWMVPHGRAYRSRFWPLTGIRKHTNKNLYNAPVRLCWVRNWHKGQNWKASLVRFAYTDSGFCFRLMEWEIQTCKCNSALTLSIHLPKKREKKIILLPFSSTNMKSSTNERTLAQAFVGFGAK